MKKKLITGVLLCMAMLTGCVRESERKPEAPKIPVYEKNVYETALVCEGDLTPKYTIRLQSKDYEVKKYTSESEQTIKKVWIKEGDSVKKGDVLIQFENKELEEQLQGYKQEEKELQREILHGKKLRRIDKSQMELSELSAMAKRLKVTRLYIKETKKQLSKYEIKATKARVVTKISQSVFSGTVKAQETLVEVTSGENRYESEISKEIKVKKGDVYKATSGLGNYSMKVINVSKMQEKQKVLWKPLEALTSSAITEGLTLEISGKKLRNVLYVPEEAVREKAGKAFLYILDDKGYQRVQLVQVEKKIAGYDILKSGVSVGEKVILP